MRVIFMGTPEFAVPSLRALHSSSYDVVAVFTQPDRPAGRGQKPQPPPVKSVALLHQIPVFQPEKLRDEALRPLFADLRPDYLAVVAYGQILPGWVLESARIAPVNVHGSLLPKYRGAAPVVWALLNGDSTTGITTMLMDEHLDTGAILLQREIRIGDAMTAGELADSLAHLGAELLIPTLDGLSDKTVHPVKQDDAAATWAPRISKDQALISWKVSASEVHNRIRAFQPWPLAFAWHRGDRIQLLRSRVSAAVPPGAIRPGAYLGKSEKGILIQCGESTVVEILELRAANRRPVSGCEFANGARLSPGDLAFHDEIG